MSDYSELQEQLARTIFSFRKLKLNYKMDCEIHPGEMHAMMKILCHSGKSTQNVLYSELQEDLSVTKSAISHMFNSLETKGYITREIDRKDRRKVLVTLTPRGEELLVDMKKRSDESFCKLSSRFGEEKIKQLIVLLNEFSEVMESVKNDSN